MRTRATVIGGGAFGTAISQVLGRKGIKVNLWARENDVVSSINQTHENRVFLPGIRLSENISATSNIRTALETPNLILLAIPSQFLRSFLTTNRSILPVKTPIVCCTKGIEVDTLQCPHEILMDVLPGEYHSSLLVLSGPSFANEIASGCPSAVLLASPDSALSANVQQTISDNRFRVYTGDDMIGAEIAGAVKNVLAIAVGAAHGHGLGNNTSAMLISRGLAEMTNLAISMGGRKETMMGLAGVGDLVLTCSSQKSRNFTVGMRIAKGEQLSHILNTHSVAEGVVTSKSIRLLAEKFNVSMPICEMVYQMIYENRSFENAFDTLLELPLSVEYSP